MIVYRFVLTEFSVRSKSFRFHSPHDNRFLSILLLVRRDRESGRRWCVAAQSDLTSTTVREQERQNSWMRHPTGFYTTAASVESPQLRDDSLQYVSWLGFFVFLSVLFSNRIRRFMIEIFKACLSGGILWLLIY